MEELRDGRRVDARRRLGVAAALDVRLVQAHRRDDLDAVDAASRSATPGETGEKPSSCVTISAVRLNCSSITLSTEPRSPAAKIAVKTTSASPIISAEAVIAVRCGWRSAFSRASLPGIPWNRSIGAPMNRASGRTSTGASSATPNIITTTPSPSSEAAARAVGAANSPTTSASSPSAMTALETRAACGSRGAGRASRTRASPPPARPASPGGPARGPTRAWRSCPTASPTMIVRGAITVPVEGSSMPTDASRQRRPGAITRPAQDADHRRHEPDHERLERRPS